MELDLDPWLTKFSGIQSDKKLVELDSGYLVAIAGDLYLDPWLAKSRGVGSGSVIKIFQRIVSPTVFQEFCPGEKSLF